ncbi:cadherin-like beta sandwich domain-containing protein [Marinicrinis lubricantis]|uniref:Cadherin-like beta sandwich domain-containing protein n=1 Tax=Marinicrinis lubricantis TaxID=2086470 RepID=A0ABW1IRZ0_9BACL
MKAIKLILVLLCSFVMIGVGKGLEPVRAAGENEPSVLYFTTGFSLSGKVNKLELKDGAVPETLHGFSWDAPEGIVVDQKGEYIYYLVRETYNQIYRSGIDGTDREIIHVNDRYMHSLFLDEMNDKLYFTDGLSGTGPNYTGAIARLRSINPSGGTVQDIHVTPEDGFQGFSAMTIDQQQGNAYLLDIFGKKLLRQSLAGGAPVTLMEYNDWFDQFIDETDRKLYYADARSIYAVDLSNLNFDWPETIYTSQNEIISITKDPLTGDLYFAEFVDSYTSHIYRLEEGSSTATLVVTTGYVNDMVIGKAPPTYTIAPIVNTTLTELAAGYESSTQETKNITIKRTGTGTLNNVSVTLSGTNADSFELTQPAVTTLDSAAPQTTFTVKAKDALAAGTYTATVTVMADHMEDVTFQVTQVVHSYTIEAIANQTLTELTTGYVPGTQETKDVTITRTGTGVLDNVTVLLNGANPDAFEVTQPSAAELDGTNPSASFTLKAKNGLTTGTYTAVVTVRADYMADVTFNVIQVVNPSPDARLRELHLSEGTLSPAFHSEVSEYTVSVPYTTDRMTVTAETYYEKAVLRVYDNELTGPISLEVGVNRIKVEVTAEDGVTHKNYTIDVTRAPSSNASMSSLYLAGIPLNETFQPNLYQYTANVMNDVYGTLVYSQAEDPNATIVMKVNGQFAVSPISLVVGSNVIEIEVTAQDGVTKQTYLIDVTREASGNAQLSQLIVSEGAMSPIFHPSIYSYSANVFHETEFVSVTASVYHENATLTVNGVLTTSGSSVHVPLSLGSNLVSIMVTAENGIDTANYTVLIWRELSSNADLIDIKMSSGTLVPDFEAARTQYQLEVPHDMTEISVTAAAQDAGAVVKVNGIVWPSGVSSSPITLSEGENTITIEVTAQDGVTTKVYVIQVMRQSAPPTEPPPPVEQPGDGEPSEGGGSNEGTRAEDEESPNDNISEELPSVMELTIGGSSYHEILESTKVTEEGRTKLHIGFDAGAFYTALEAIEDEAVVNVIVKQAADEVTVALPVNALKMMADKRIVLFIHTENGNYKIPAEEVISNRAISQFGAADLEQLTVTFTIARSDDTQFEMIERTASRRGFTVVAPLVDFSVTASYHDQTVELNRFGRYIRREIPLRAEVGRESITTAVIQEADGTLRHVPMYITADGGQHLAVIHSLSNSTYAFISYPVQYTDTVNHWAGEDVHDLASRMVVSGVGQGRFNPDAAVTRAEFAAIIGRALGLPTLSGRAEFHDIETELWYAGSIAAAQEYGIIHGYEDGTFRPSATITREEAIVMIMRALSVASSLIDMSDDQVQSLLYRFTDGKQVSGWAASVVASAVQSGLVSGSNGQLRPMEVITRAEAASIVRRLLQQANLID